MTTSPRRDRLIVYALATALVTGVASLAWVRDGAALSTLQPAEGTAATAPVNPAFATDKSLATLANGLAALTARQIDQARALRDALPADSLDRHILAWAIALKGGDSVPSAEITRTARDLPGWPGMEVLRRNSERALLKEQPAPETVLRAFGDLTPQTPEGAIILARAHVALGDPDRARQALSTTWRTAKMDAADEAAIISEFGGLIPAEDHRFRMERMLYSERAKSAGRVAKLAGAEALASAWSAVLRNDPNAAKLLDAVPDNQRSAGYLFAKAQFLRKQKRLSEAAKVMNQAPADRIALVDPDAWWIERRLLSRQLLDAGLAKLAYEVAAGHAAESATNAADAEFHAGWYALRSLGDPKTAAKHFARIAEVVGRPDFALTRLLLARPSRGSGSSGRSQGLLRTGCRLRHHLLWSIGGGKAGPFHAQRHLSRAERGRPRQFPTTRGCSSRRTPSGGRLSAAFRHALSRTGRPTDQPGRTGSPGGDGRKARKSLSGAESRQDRRPTRPRYRRPVASARARSRPMPTFPAPARRWPTRSRGKRANSMSAPYPPPARVACCN